MQKHKILLIAYQCGHGMGSVSQIGWEWYSRLRLDYDVTLVTHIRNRDALQKSDLGEKIIYVDTEWFAGPLYRFAKFLFPHSEHSVFLISSLDCMLFDLSAYFQLRRLKKRGIQWEVLHRVTPVTLAAPTALGLLDVPMILGPLNCGLGQPPGFRRQIRAEISALNPVRALGYLANRLIGSCRHARRILVGNPTTRDKVPAAYQPRCVYMCENGVALEDFTAAPWPYMPGSERILKLAFVGRLVAVKGLNFLIDAVAALTQRGYRVQLSVAGDGPLRAEWQARAQALGLGEQIRFYGNLSRPQVAFLLQSTHAMVLPSLRESGGAVLLEAMACARPVIALNFGGPAQVVDEQVGALLPMDDEAQIVRDLSSTLEHIIQSPQEWAEKGRVARQRIEAQYAWNVKVAAAGNLYQEIIAEGC
ncbi:glycosyltransferase family 4 protein [Undibacterium squillarum]|uniref:Glycosyl transferase family 1 domain-containing protein n=1 Tax=Undibacterium squillarum TaxID=1131567 RepID=A0ABQ2XVP6_9BURK|nr:glycosyltransferase family 4 protein [Undibacterium squillarum]GGX36494.1 hypothetical protein GCM10010946_12870 [Undibacterium squillarum]